MNRNRFANFVLTALLVAPVAFASWAHAATFAAV